MTINEVKNLYYNKGLSCREIGKKLGMTVWQVIDLMKMHKLKRRSPTDTLKLQFSRKPLSFHKNINLTYKEKNLLLAGLMIYWAEGTKTDNRTVDLANSNERMVLIFLTMLRKIYRVQEKRLRVLIYGYANQDPKILVKLWSKKLQIPRIQFIKPYMRQDYNPNKIHKMPHGLVHVRYNDKKLFMKIWEDIDIIANSLLNKPR
jgi:hypothetical protein